MLFWMLLVARVAALAPSQGVPAPPSKVSPPSKVDYHDFDGFRCAFRGAAGRLLALRLMYGFLVRSAYSLHAHPNP